MSDHDRVRSLLALAASGDVTPQELRLVRAHLAQCEECRRHADDFAVLAEAVRRIPTPQPRPEVLAQVRALVAAGPRRGGAGNGEARLVGLLVAASWVVAVASWPMVKNLPGRLFELWQLPAGGIGTALAVYSVLGFMIACICAIAVARRAHPTGRTR